MVRIFPEMQCCKPWRQLVGLECDAHELVFCLARQCAKLPTLGERRAFAAKVSEVTLVQVSGLGQSFKDQVVQTYTQNQKGKA